MKPTNVSTARLEAVHQLSLRRAAAVAIHSSSELLSYYHESSSLLQNVPAYVAASKERMQIQTMIYDAELQVLDKLGDMDKTDRTLVVFDVLDHDGDQTLQVEELAEAMRVFNGFDDINIVLPLARKAVQTYGTQSDSLNVDQVEAFLSTMARTFKCSFRDLCIALVQKSMAKETGAAILDHAVTAIFGPRGKQQASSSDIDGAVIEARLMLLFAILKSPKSTEDTVNLKNVVKHLLAHNGQAYQLEKHICSMLKQSARDSRPITFDDFAELLMNIITTLDGNPQDMFHIVANSITKSVCTKETSEDDFKKDLSQFGNMLNKAISDSAGSNSGEDPSMPTTGRLIRLFAMFDSDHSGTVDLKELALGLRCFQKANNLDESLDSSIEAFQAADSDNDGSLDVKEFGIMLAKFAEATHVDVDDLIDFMLVHTAVNYDHKLGKDEERKLDRIMNRGRRSSGFFGFFQWPMVA
eukprot:CAMPEP_0194029746 /NCGR_PEP_ID=MMETSP0009_2-20130614/3405_1 /TAXON_ID=210454 /ORGANISM="Grammatophora oceanica, Strain CCMP 410" /LENGTH=468 /DNA_ID=CAMNT_0038669513 /DNA_START=60 /DNA_END=1466 /DNA_ORIENTATION=+